MRFRSENAVFKCGRASVFEMLFMKKLDAALRYHVSLRWIDSVWKSRPYADAFEENPINLYIF